MLSIAHGMTSHHVLKLHDRAVRTTIEGYMCHKALHTALATSRGQWGQSRVDHVLPFFQGVIEVMIERHRCAGAFYRKQEAYLVDGLLVTFHKPISQDRKKF